MQIVCGDVSIVELDNGYAVCRLKNFRMLYWTMDANDMRYANRTYARTHRQNSQLNTLVWGSLMLAQLGLLHEWKKKHISALTVVIDSIGHISNCWTGFSTGTWDWNVGLEHGTGMWDRNLC